MSQHGTCGQCIYWDCLSRRWSGAYDDCDTEGLASRGACMRYPPKVLAEPGFMYLRLVAEDGTPTGETESVSYIDTDYPTTHDHDWCGEFRAKPLEESPSVRNGPKLSTGRN